MTNSTSERERRLKEIRLGPASIPNNAVSYKMWADIQFLLSLLDSEAEGGDTISRKEVVARIERQIRLWNNDTVTMACADILADVKQLPAFNTATSMRDLCVEKVKARRSEKQAEADAKRDPDNPHDYHGSYGLAVGAVDVCEDIIEDLQSLTLDQVEQKTK